jgi:hypothetical protein
MKKKGDVKFIIYQSLYIFVICVIAIKGANIDLVQVVTDDGKVRAEITPDSLIRLQELLSRSLIVDSSRFVIVPKELLAENEKLQQIVQNMPKIDLNSYMPKMDMSQYVKMTPEQKKILEEQKKEEPSQMQEIRIGNISLTQYTSNTLNNPYDVPLEVVGITTIPPKSTKTFETGGQGSIVIRVGTSSKTVELKPNEKPKINFSRIASMGADTRVTSLQSSVCYRVTISDDFPGQLDVKFSGPMTVKQSGNTYDVTMNAFSSKAAFDNFIENKEAPYSLGFTVTVTDKIAGHKIAGQNSFYFGEW